MFVNSFCFVYCMVLRLMCFVESLEKFFLVCGLSYVLQIVYNWFFEVNLNRIFQIDQGSVDGLGKGI